MTERQRRRRARLRHEGRIEATIPVHADRAARLRAIADALDKGHAVSPRLIPALAVLRGLRSELERRGIARAGVFGSTARGEDRPDSDLDVLLALAPEADLDVLALARIQEEVRAVFASRMPGVEVDVSLLDDMRDAVRPNAEAEAVYAY